MADSLLQALIASGKSEFAGLQAFQPIPSIFTDNTHLVYQLEFLADSSLERRTFSRVLKILRADNLLQNSFWQQIYRLFGLDLRKNLHNQIWLGQKLAELARFSGLKIPQILAAENLSTIPGKELPGFVLAEFLPGKAGNQSLMNQQNIEVFARWFYQLQQYKFATWGMPASSAEPEFALPTFGEKLADSLQEFALKAQQSSDNQIWLQQNFAQTLQQAKDLQPTTAVFTMLDLRWDQFLFDKNQQIYALVDLDAFVIAPPELSWVMLEYLFDHNQIWLFKQAYQKLGGEIPDLTAVRNPYQLWLFALNILGETNLQKWMSHPNLV